MLRSAPTSGLPLVCWTATILACVLVAAAIGAIVVLAIDVFFLVLLGVLFAILLTKVSDRLTRLTRLPYGVALSVVVVLILATTVGALAIFGVQLEDQISRTSQRMDGALEHVNKRLDQYPAARGILARLPFAGPLLTAVDDAGRPGEGASPNASANGAPASSADTTSQSGSVASDRRETVSQDQGDGAASQRGEATSQQDEAAPDPRDDTSQQASTPPSGQSGQADGGQADGDGNGSEAAAMQGSGGRLAGHAMQTLGQFFATSFGAVANLVVIFFVGLFVAARPLNYRDGLVRLFPIDYRQQTKNLLNDLGHTLWRWILGQSVSMAISGVGTTIALWLLGVPLAVTLGIITAVLTFVPNIGAVVSLSLAVLVALPEGRTVALSVIGVYSALQLIESYIVTPLIQQRQVDIPPALLIATQVLMGVLTGFLGVIVAAPLLAIALVLVRRLYVEGTLESGGHVPDRGAAAQVM